MPTRSQAEQVEKQAREAVRAAVRSSYDRRTFTVSKFGRHPDGYLHARVVIDGQPYYLHRRYGSWLAPGQVGPRSVLKEPEALLGSVIGHEVKMSLSEKSRPFDEAVRRERARREEEERNAAREQQPGGEAEGPDGDAPPAHDDRVRAGDGDPDGDGAV